MKEETDSDTGGHHVTWFRLHLSFRYYGNT